MPSTIPFCSLIAGIIHILLEIRETREQLTRNFCFRSPSEGGQRSIYILRDSERCLTKAVYIQQLTDLRVLVCDSETLTEFDERFEESQVIQTFPGSI